jgi:protein-S-isoprenylcysteine O-methyltransferase Ste14
MSCRESSGDVRSKIEGERDVTSAKMLITGLTSVAIQFALAIAGWGGWTAFWAHRQFQGLAWVTAGLMLLAIFTKGGCSTSEKEDRSNRWVLGAFGVIAMLMTFFSSYTDRIGFWTLDGDTMRWIGVVVCAAGGLLRILPVYVLGRRFSGLVAIQTGHKLETHGMYGLIRNPSYLGLMTTSLGYVLTFRSGVGVLLALSLLAPLVARIRAEERLLREHFGAEYDAYCARTWRLLPGIY